MARLTAKTRNALPDSAFAGRGRTYPVQNPSHARDALSLASQHASPALESKIQAKVHRRFPGISQPKFDKVAKDYVK
jgi:hypothetical protein